MLLQVKKLEQGKLASLQLRLLQETEHTLVFQSDKQDQDEET